MPSAINARFNLNEIAAAFPGNSDTMLIDTYLSDEPSASSRVFRVYREVPPHYHVQCDENLLVLSGRGVFWIADPSNAAPVEAGHFLHFKRGVVHAMTEIL